MKSLITVSLILLITSVGLGQERSRDVEARIKLNQVELQRELDSIRQRRAEIKEDKAILRALKKMEKAVKSKRKSNNEEQHAGRNI